jgi:hypothetical protein
MSTVSSESNQKDYEVPCELFSVTELDASQAMQAERKANDGALGEEVVHPVVELNGTPTVEVHETRPGLGEKRSGDEAAKNSGDPAV